MGRCVIKPLVKMNGQGPPAPRLLWYDVTRCGEEAGEILAAFELFLVRETKSYLFFSFVCGVLLCVNHFLSLRKVKETHDQNQFSYYERLLSVTKRMQEHFMNNLNEH